jgi:hypothetical protein
MLHPEQKPIARFDPVEFELISALAPIATLLLPVVLALSALHPTAKL